MKTLSFKMRKGFTLIELLVVIGILAILLAITLIAINPARQFRQANDTKRASDVNAILNAVGQYAADAVNRGAVPANIPLTTAAEIGSDTVGGQIDICNDLVPTFIQALPTDPTDATGDPVIIDPATNVCTTPYATGYFIVRDANGRVTVSAPGTQEAPIDISVTR